MRVEIEELPGTERSVEIVERKGRGHPDSICDALAEASSVALSKYYLAEHGAIFHHNLDKVLLVGGASDPAFGGGRVRHPIEIYVAGRASVEIDGRPVPVEEIVRSACAERLRALVAHLDPAEHVRLHVRVRAGSADLVDLFRRQREQGVWLSNDTSIGVGFAPETTLERAVLAIDRELAAARRPERGEDSKVMGIRFGESFSFTLSHAFVDRHLTSMADYHAAKELTAKAARDALPFDAPATVNAADDEASERVFLTVTGTSAEAGDDGEAGRGNRAGGLITPMRPMTMESVAGKNPVSHVGKIYNVAARSIAERVARELDASEVECFLVSRIGAPVARPQIASVRARFRPGDRMASRRQSIEAAVEDELACTSRLFESLLRGEHVLF